MLARTIEDEFERLKVLPSNGAGAPSSGAITVLVSGVLVPDVRSELLKFAQELRAADVPLEVVYPWAVATDSGWLKAMLEPHGVTVRKAKPPV